MLGQSGERDYSKDFTRLESEIMRSVNKLTSEILTIHSLISASLERDVDVSAQELMKRFNNIYDAGKILSKYNLSEEVRKQIKECLDKLYEGQRFGTYVLQNLPEKYDVIHQILNNIDVMLDKRRTLPASSFPHAETSFATGEGDAKFCQVSRQPLSVLSIPKIREETSDSKISGQQLIQKIRNSSKKSHTFDAVSKKELLAFIKQIETTNDRQGFSKEQLESITNDLADLRESILKVRDIEKLQQRKTDLRFLPGVTSVTLTERISNMEEICDGIGKLMTKINANESSCIIG